VIYVVVNLWQVKIPIYTFLNIREKIHQFLSSVKRDAHKRKLVPFFLPHGVDVETSLCSAAYVR